MAGRGRGLAAAQGSIPPAGGLAAACNTALCLSLSLYLSPSLALSICVSVRQLQKHELCLLRLGSIGSRLSRQASNARQCPAVT